MVLAVGRVRDGETLVGVVNSLVNAASMDPYGREFLNEEQHRDGWGALIIGIRDSSVAMLHHRSVKPIFEDNPVGVIGPFLKSLDGVVVMMVHARAASTGTPINIFSTHPVRAITNGGSELYMVHNGSFSKDLLLKAADVSEGVASRYNDTYIANLALARRIGNDVGKDDLAWLLNHVRTGANLGVALISSDYVSFIAGSYYRLLNDGRDGVRERYYRIYMCEVGDLTIYASSTVIDHYKPSQLAKDNCHIIANGEYHKYILHNNGDMEERQVWLLSR
jgi:Predicted glutamine amidotransferase